MNEINAVLTQLGLSDKEALTYTALLELGDSSAYAISKKSGLKKPTTYVILDELRKKDLVTKKPQAKRTLYSAKDPEELLEVAKNNLQNIQEIIPKLRSLKKKDNLQLQTLFYDGTKEIGEALKYNITKPESKDLVGFYAHIENSQKLTSILPILDIWEKNMFENNIRIKGVAPKHKSLETVRKDDEKHNREMKEVDFSDYSSEISIDTFGSVTRIVDLVEHQAVIIDNPRVAKTVREIFEMVWKKS